MSYVRFIRGHSDVYVYEGTLGGKDMLCCCGCNLEDVSFWCATPDEMATHLRAHVAAGDLVPDHVIPNVIERTEMQFVKMMRSVGS